MSVKINYINANSKKNSSNFVLFVDEKFSIYGLKKYLSNTEYNFITDLLKTKDHKKHILSFDINSKRKIILVSLKKGIKNSDVENLGAKFYDLFKEFKQGNYVLNSDCIGIKQKKFIGYFLHGIKLKSYKFQKYKTKKYKGNIIINVIGDKKPSIKDRVKFNSIEEGTFFTRDLVSEPGNVLHTDE